MDLGPIDLDLTLDCGQAFRWRRDGKIWVGAVRGKVVRLQQRRSKVDVEAEISSRELEAYFRLDDDLEEMKDALARDAYVRKLMERFPGLRLLRQEPWECAASFVLATNANVPRIKKMIESVCRTYGTEIEPGLFSFPTPEQIVQSEREAQSCGLGYRCQRFVQFAVSGVRGELRFERWKKVPYGQCVAELKRFHGIGDKVADCIALFCLDHLEAFPVDVRIKRVMSSKYAVEGSYKKVNGWARSHFGRYAGYAQEYLFLTEDARLSRR